MSPKMSSVVCWTHFRVFSLLCNLIRMTNFDFQETSYGMSKSIFDIKEQHNDVSGKIVVGLERISEAFRVLLWDQGKQFGLSPIQIQILIFVKYHADEMCGVSYIAKEFNVTKPTVSDAIKSLEAKGYVRKEQGSTDSRSFLILLTADGEKMVNSVENFAHPIKQKIDQLKEEDQLNLLNSIVAIVHQLNASDILNVQRTCYACKYFERTKNGQYCHLMKSDLALSQIRLDCPEFDGLVDA